VSNPCIDKQKHQIWSIASVGFHRLDGPAIIYTDSGTEWWFNGHLHRTIGPTYIDSIRKQEWWINNTQYYDNKSYQDAANLSDEDMLMINLKYGDVK
jgi:hypothetical protein